MTSHILCWRCCCATATVDATVALLFICILAKIVIIIHDDLFILVNSEISTIYLISFFFLYSVRQCVLYYCCCCHSHWGFSFSVLVCIIHLFVCSLSTLLLRLASRIVEMATSLMFWMCSQPFSGYRVDSLSILCRCRHRHLFFLMEIEKKTFVLQFSTTLKKYVDCCVLHAVFLLFISFFKFD